MVAIREFETQPAELFTEALTSLRRQLSLFAWQGFFEPLSFISCGGGAITVGAPSSFHLDWVRNHYVDDIETALSHSFGKPMHLKLQLANEFPHPNNASQQEPSPPLALTPTRAIFPTETISPLKAPSQTPIGLNAPIVFESARLNPANTFDTFIMGTPNTMGYTACKAVAEQPGAQYSPLFLFGPVGIGKTHLLQAIGLHVLSNTPSAKVLYMTAEQWVNAYISSIREKKFDAFRRKFRTDCDILLVDDIQFLAGKDASQDEFFHTFNCLHQAHKQIVVTSDKYPHEIEGLEERLQTRLSWGLIADIRPPDGEMRKAIIGQKANKCGLELPHDVVEHMSKRLASSVRELEGAIIRLSACTKGSNKKITIDTVNEILSPVLKGSNEQLNADKICGHVAAYYDLKPMELRGQSRQRQVALARQIAMALCRNIMAYSLPEIGRFFGGRDHTTVLSSLRKIEDMRETNISIQTVLARLEKSLLEVG
ncbi:MAG: chromosomal replication initiator protein DnaA [Deltaproteobacteria bacterium]|nr:chromosomal replication initiator protein DnaA [Deltaproteobacteria bacterium]